MQEETLNPSTENENTPVEETNTETNGTETAVAEGQGEAETATDENQPVEEEGTADAEEATDDSVGTDEVAVDENLQEKTHADFKVLVQFDEFDEQGNIVRTYLPDQIVTLPLAKAEEYVAEGKVESHQ